MRVLVIGSGGREHALAWKIAQSPLVESLLAAPGSDAMAELAHCFPAVPANDLDAVVALARAERVDLAVVGPEDPLVAGLADRLREAGIATFGPSAEAARLEGSKAFAKAFMQRHGIPTADFAVFDDLDAAREHVRRRPRGCVVKADGLAAGKGVAVCDSAAQALAALDEMMARAPLRRRRRPRRDRGAPPRRGGFLLRDQRRRARRRRSPPRRTTSARSTATAARTPAAWAPMRRPRSSTRRSRRGCSSEIVHPAIRGLAAEGTPYRGVLFVGLMIDAAGEPSAIEFNVRFGDPETQALLVATEGDLVPLLDAAARGGLERVPPPTTRGAAVCVVLASEGYPRAR